MKNVLAAIIVLVVFLLIWEAACQTFEYLRFVLPSPIDIAISMWERSDRLLHHAEATVKEMVGGFLLALAVAFPSAWSMYQWKTFSYILQPFFVTVQCIPMFTLAPLMVLWFGWTYTAIVIPTALMIFFPLTMNIYQGLCSVPKPLLDYFQINQATSWQVFIKLQLPWAMPQICAGFRISAALAGIGAIAGEWAGAQAGLGILMIESRRGTDLEMTFAALIALTLVSLSVYLVMIIAEKWIFKRRPLRLRRAGILSAIMIGMILFSGCRSSDKEKSNEVRLMLDWLPNPDHVPIYVGIEKGIFKKHGINLQIMKIQDPGDVIPYLSSGRTDLALYYMPETIKAIKNGHPLQPIGFLVKQPLNAFIYRTDLGIQQPSDLNGKKIGYCTAGFGEIFLRRILAENNIVPSELIYVSFDLVSVLGVKQVDVIYGAYWNIESEHLRSFGIDNSYFTLKSLGFPNYDELIFIAKDHSPQSNPKFVQAFKLALQESIDESRRNPKEAFDSYSKSNPDKTNKTLKWEQAAWENTVNLLATDQEWDEIAWHHFIDWTDQSFELFHLTVY